jgi:ABC-2 type transport system permease protein
VRALFDLHGLDAVFYKEVRHVVRDPATLVLAIAMPLMQLLLFGYAINLKVEHIRSAYYSEDRGRLAEQVVDGLTASRGFDIVSVAPSRAVLMQEIVAGKVHVGFAFPENFSADVLRGKPSTMQVLIDGSDSSIAQSAYGSAAQIGTALSQRLGAANAIPGLVDIRPRMLFNPTLRSANFLVPGLIGLVMQNITVMLTALSIVGERERGTLDQILVTPIGTTALMFGKLVPYGIVGFLDFLLVLAAMHWVFGVPIAGNLPLLLILGAGFLLTVLGLGLLISTFARSQMQAMLLAAFILLPSVLLSGMLFERELMPPAMQGVSYALPLTYFLEILRGIIVRGAGLSDLWFPATATVVFGIAVLGLASIRFARTTS